MNSYFRYIRYMRAVIWRHHKNKIFASVIATGLFGIIILVLNKIYYNCGFWDNFLFRQGIDVLFCEHTDMQNLIRQPVNTFTNFSYMVNAVFFTVKGIEDYRRRNPYNLITANSFYSITLGFISLYTFFGSTFFHASLIMSASKIDFSAVYSVSLYPLMYFTHRLWLLVTKRESKVKHQKGMLVLIAIFTSIYLSLTLFIVEIKYIHITVFAFILLTAIFGIVLDRADKGKSNKLYLWLTIIFISIAIVFFELDFTKILCNPDSFIQPHSLWHICNGFSVFYFYLYIRSEHYDSQHDREVLALKEQFLRKAKVRKILQQHHK